MSGFKRTGTNIYDPVTGAWVGGIDQNGVEQMGLSDASTNSSGTPGNASSATPRGRAAFAAAGSTVVITNALVLAASSIFVQLGGADATLTSVRVTAAAGSFTVTGNAGATGTTPFDYLIRN